MPNAPKSFGSKKNPPRSAHKRGYDAAHERRRRECLERAGYLCEECARHGKVTEATVADHIKPHRGNRKLLTDLANHQALCGPCHTKKTAEGR